MPELVGCQTMVILDPNGMNFDAVGVFGLVFQLLFKSGSHHTVNNNWVKWYLKEHFAFIHIKSQNIYFYDYDQKRVARKQKLSSRINSVPLWVYDMIIVCIFWSTSYWISKYIHSIKSEIPTKVAWFICLMLRSSNSSCHSTLDWSMYNRTLFFQLQLFPWWGVI